MEGIAGTPPGLHAAAGEPCEDELWRRFRAAGDGQARAALVQRHLPYARVVAAWFYARRMHDEIGFEDFLQYARLGLLESLDRYDPARGAQFRTFASRRMQGAILDGLERSTEKQQQIAARQRLRAGRTEAVLDLARESSGPGRGGADAGGQRLLHYVAEAGIGLALAWLLEGTGMIDDPQRSEHVPFYAPARLKETRCMLLALVDALPEQERIVIRSHYLQEVPFESVATTLGLTRGRISQIHKQGLRRLREAAGREGLLDAGF